ncbi:MAG: hypothetical protein FWC80_07770, partial [Firmicutes bacterium]|nr:hypothetical protein [Bacillota bacterium]
KNTKNTSFYSFLSANARSFASLRMTDQQCLSSKIGFRYKSNDTIKPSEKHLKHTNLDTATTIGEKE